MPYSSYTDSVWIVSQADPDSKCQPGDQIKFEGPADKVIISCNGKVDYMPGEYKDKINAIERSKDYVILMMTIPTFPPFQIITFTQKDPLRSSGGSWTADDSIPPEPAKG